MRHAILVFLSSWFSREQSGKLAVKIDQILCIFPSLELILCTILSRD